VSIGELLPALEPRIAALLARHKEAATRIDWSYHDFLPIEAYCVDRTSRRQLSYQAYLAVETALLTEVNLPWYTSALHQNFCGTLAPMEEFVRLWTSEEDQHAMLLESYLLITDNGDHAKRNHARRSVLANGWFTDVLNPFEAVVYTSIQELSTRAFYLHAAEACEGDDRGLAEALRRIAKDETLHMTFYRDVVKAHLDADPDYIIPLAAVLMRFELPGAIMADFKERSASLARSGIYDPRHFNHEVIDVLWSYWDLDRLEPRLTDGRAALQRLRRYRSVLQRIALRFAAQAPATHTLERA
jgi:acyl-[acyl-carrier-protein] desaturase